MSLRTRALGVLLLAWPRVGAPAPAQDQIALAEEHPWAAPLPVSAIESRLWADLDRRLADPSAWQALVAAEAPDFYEGHLFPYVLPVMALASRHARCQVGMISIFQILSVLRRSYPSTACHSWPVGCLRGRAGLTHNA